MRRKAILSGAVLCLGIAAGFLAGFAKDLRSQAPQAAEAPTAIPSEAAAKKKLPLKDWRDPNTLAKMTDGELFYVVTNGRGKMTGGEGDRTSEEVRWNLVN